MDDQLQFPLSIENLYPAVSRRSKAKTVEDNRAIAGLMQKFDLTEEEATESHFARIKHPGEGASR
jgi:hypothetical protein